LKFTFAWIWWCTNKFPMCCCELAKHWTFQVYSTRLWIGPWFLLYARSFIAQSVLLCSHVVYSKEITQCKISTKARPFYSLGTMILSIIYVLTRNAIRLAAEKFMFPCWRS
jgi:hypothetical protein